jgi:hypothetical protein
MAWTTGLEEHPRRLLVPEVHELLMPVWPELRTKVIATGNVVPLTAMPLTALPLKAWPLTAFSCR